MIRSFFPVDQEEIHIRLPYLIADHLATPHHTDDLLVDLLHADHRLPHDHLPLADHHMEGEDLLVVIARNPPLQNPDLILQSTEFPSKGKYWS